jgi:hypothetical protein
MECILYKIYFWKGFSYVLQIDMHLICTPMLAKFYSCKKWVLHLACEQVVRRVHRNSANETGVVVEVEVLAAGELVGWAAYY